VDPDYKCAIAQLFPLLRKPAKLPPQACFRPGDPLASSPSWLPRLHAISRAVSDSVRSHYDRRDLEHLFELQPRAAQKLLELLPSVTVGTSRLVEGSDLLGFLDRVREADDTAALFETMRREKGKVSRRKVRSLVRRDLDSVGLSSLPEATTLSRGRLEVNFRSVEQLAESLLLLARVLENEGEEFAEAYEVREETVEDAGADEVRRMFEELEEMRRNT